MKKKEIAEKLINQGKADRHINEDITYETLSDDDRKGVDEAVATMQTVGNIFNDLIAFQAKLVRKYFVALQKVGFTPEEALAIAARSPVPGVKE
jgi:hypothetical protein